MQHTIVTQQTLRRFSADVAPEMRATPGSRRVSLRKHHEPVPERGDRL